MRSGFALVAGLMIAGAAWAQKKPEPPPRFGVPAETEFYPQDAPKQALASIAKAFDRQRIDYLLAHLLDPTFADEKMAQYYRQKFGKLPDEDRELTVEQRDARAKEALKLFVAEVNDHMASNTKQTLRFFRLLKEGNVEEAGTLAKVTLKDAPNVVLTLRQVEGRWYMANDRETDATARPEPGRTDKPKN